MRRIGLIGATAVALCAVAAGPASAGPPKATQPATLAAGWLAHQKRPSLPAGFAATALPKGYVLRTAGPFDLPASSQRRGTVSWPGRKVPFGGGAFIQTSALLGGINSSFPSGKKWVIDANNGSFSATTFSVYVICAAKPK